MKNTLPTLLAWAFACLCLQAQAAPTIYKHVDESGRITYSNAPIKGAEKVELQPITVLPAAAPATARVATAGGVARVTSLPRAAKAITVSTTPAGAEANTASVEPAPAASALPDSRVASSTPLSTAGLMPSAGPAATLAAPQRLDEVQQRNLKASLLGEQESLANAKAQLAEEAKNSDAMRALRASFTAGPDQASIRKIITAEMRAQVERHFERIRDLQDEIAMHENNVAGLRAQLRTEAGPGVVAAK
jgi:Domain of unknown function (DUF4124)